jgi:hypothetical protein
MKVFSFRRIDSGEFIGATYTGDPAHLAANTPAGCEAVEGLHFPPLDPASAARDERGTMLRRIQALEGRQGRALRELALDPESVAARDRLEALDRDIANLRARLLPAVQ